MIIFFYTEVFNSVMSYQPQTKVLDTIDILNLCEKGHNNCIGNIYAGERFLVSSRR